MTQAQTTTKVAQDTANNARKALAEAKAKLASDEELMAKLQEAEGNLKRAKANLAQASKSQEEAKTVLGAEQAKLAALIEVTILAKAKLDEAQQAFDKVSQDYNTLLQLENLIIPSNNTSAGNQITYTIGQKTVPTVTPLVSGTVTTNTIPAKNNTSTVTPTDRAGKTLPNTGSKISPLGLLGLYLISLLGLAKIRKTSK